MVSAYSGVNALARLDGRTKEARLLKRVRAELTAEVGGSPSLLQRQLIERAAVLTLRCQQLDAKIFAGAELGQHDSNYLIAWNNALRRCLRDLGLAPKRGDGRAAPPSLAELFGTEDTAA